MNNEVALLERDGGKHVGARLDFPLVGICSDAPLVCVTRLAVVHDFYKDSPTYGYVRKFGLRNLAPDESPVTVYVEARHVAP